ncbi:MAG: hypothetical protein ACTSU5_20195 [Promethearchaeota archaeon]
MDESLTTLRYGQILALLRLGGRKVVEPSTIDKLLESGDLNARKMDKIRQLT